MKFRLVEDTHFSLNESKVFKIHYTYPQSGKTFKDYAYVIGNNKHTADDMKDINVVRSYYKTKQKGNDIVDKDFVRNLNTVGATILSAEEMSSSDAELIKSYYNKQHKYGNKGHSTDRRQSSIDDDYITHHLCGIENNKNERNRIGLPKADDGEKLHQALHLLTISPNNHKGVRNFDVMAYDPIVGTFVPRTLVLSVEIK